VLAYGELRQLIYFKNVKMAKKNRKKRAFANFSGRIFILLCVSE
jgi:hypothetical protein